MVIIVVLVLLFFFGATLSDYAAVTKEWAFLVSGGLAMFALGWLVHQLVKPRRSVLALQVIPVMFPLASDQRAKQAAFLLIQRLSDQVV